MATTQIQSVTGGADPIDLVSTLSLTSGDYLIQNLGNGVLLLSEQDSSISDFSTLVAGHIVYVGGYLGITVESGNLMYVWSKKSCRIAVTES